RGGIGYQPYSRFQDAGPTHFGSGATPTFSTLPDLPSFIRYLFFVSTGNLVAHHFLMALDLFAQIFAQEQTSHSRSKIGREQ
ncbi:hypothetical protein, partial [Collinsella aerofaciens]|uniref:hypothetical protein n=1 Tax=Collinsella aerofaciens TaxID=74426 RepID=UPI001C1070CA